MHEKMVEKIGWFASIMSMAMYVSYLDQIRRNIAGHPGSVILPVVTVVNCMAWVLYGWLKPNKAWPIIVCNALGVFIAAATAVTAVVFER